VDASLGISRRTLLRRGAVVGGSLVWTVPVVHTLAAPSAAAGTPLDGISFVAVVLNCDGVYYRMKWDVEGATLVLVTGPSFNIPDGPQMTGYPDIQPGAAPDASASLVGETVVVSARGDCVLVDFVVKHGPCNVGPGTSGMPAVNGTGPWTFSPLASPPTC
jgi:hypothetical protein